MKLTLLNYVQNILSSMSSDEVNSISDSPESLQVAEIVKTTFFNITARAHLHEQKKLFQLDSSLSSLQPTLMTIPEGIKSVEWIKYFDADTSANMYKYVTILPVQQFADYVNGYNTADTNVDTLNFTVDSETFLFNYKNDVTPRYCTVISDFYVIFDAFNEVLDSTLQSNKTQCFGDEEPVWRMEDTFIPLLDDEQVPLLLNESKSLAFFELKQTPHVKAEQEAKRQWSSLQRDKSKDNKPSYFDQLPNYGRVSAYRNRGPFFRWH
jgi:hypothetical protein